MRSLEDSDRRLLHLLKLKRFSRFIFAASAAVLFMLTGTVRAGAEEETFPDRFGLRVGGYQIQNANTTMLLGANSLPLGAYIDFHDTLGGGQRDTVFRMDGFYRFNDHHALGFAWYDVSFTGSRVLDRDITWGDITFPINSQVDSVLKFDIYKLNYQYSLFHNEKVELGALIGLFVMHINAGISSNGLGGTNQAVTAPLPVVGLFADYKFTPRFSIYYNYQLFSLDYDNKYKGSLSDFLLGLEYRLFRNVALGVAYNRFNVNLQAKGSDATLYVNTGWNGGMLYGAVYF